MEYGTKRHCMNTTSRDQLQYLTSWSSKIQMSFPWWNIRVMRLETKNLNYDFWATLMDLFYKIIKIAKGPSPYNLREANV